MQTGRSVQAMRTKCEINYSITNKNWNDACNMQLTKHNTNDDVDARNSNDRVVHMHGDCTHLCSQLVMIVSHTLMAQVLSAFSQSSSFHPWRTLLDSPLPFYFHLFLLSFSVFLFHLELFLELHDTIVMANLRCSAAEESEDTLNAFTSPTLEEALCIPSESALLQRPRTCVEPPCSSVKP